MKEITERDRDNLCDMLWWLKGYKKGAEDNFNECPFNSDHLESLSNVVNEIRDQLNKAPVAKEPEGPQTDISTFNELVKIILSGGIKIEVKAGSGPLAVYSNIAGKFFDVSITNVDSKLEHRID